MSESDKQDRSLRSELGVSRRDLLRRGAVVGGTLLWVAPVIQSITPPAFAQAQSPVVVSCCKCRGFNAQCVTNVTQDQCAQVCGGANRVRQYLLNATCVDRGDKEGKTCATISTGGASVGSAGN